MISEEMERDAAALQQQAEELLKKKADLEANLARLRKPEQLEAAQREAEEIAALLAIPRDDSKCDCGYMVFSRFGTGGPRYHRRGCSSEVQK